MRRLAVALLAVSASVGLALTGVTQAANPKTTPTLAQCRTIAHKQVLIAGRFTVATGNDVLPPWYVDNQPSNQQGFESALAYLIATKLAFKASAVRWVTEPYSQAVTAGKKPFDIDLDEISYSAARARNVSFSTGYYSLGQSLLAVTTNRIATHHAPSDLPKYRYGAVASTASYAYAVNRIKPTRAVRAYSTLNLANAALLAGAIDAIVIDTPSGYTDVNWTLNAKARAVVVQVGQFPPVGDLYYAAVLTKSNPLRTCVDVALASARQSGQLQQLVVRWLGVFNSLPALKP
jgi:polar amino acid transport system substrate-binding protein